MPQMTINLYDRRKTMLDLYYSGVPQKTIVDQMVEREQVKRKTILQDWYRRGSWEPLIWRMEESREDAEKILYSLRLGRERALALMRTADNDNAKVGAIGKLTDVVSKEIELRQSLGSLPKVPEKLDIKERHEHVKIDATDDEDEILSKAAAILDKKLRKQKEPTEIHTGT